MKPAYVGIDVQLARPCAYAVVDEAGRVTRSGWFATVEEGVAALRPLAETRALRVGIDAPRTPLIHPRKWYWDGAKKRWREKRAADKGLGRHCEVAVKALGLANPQWTPLAAAAPDWMRLGFDLFRAFDAFATTYEAFPSASYTQLEGDASLQLTVDFSAMTPGKTDMLDAWMAAATVREFVEGRGTAVGDGDGLGSIILPRPTGIHPVAQWP